MKIPDLLENAIEKEIQKVRQPRLIKITPYMVEAIKKVKEIKEILYS